MAKSVIINGVTYPDVPSVNIPGTNSTDVTFYETSDATASNGDVLATKTYYKNGGKYTGSMANNGSTSGTISTKDGTVTIPAGYTSGGTVEIASSAKASIISGNIKSGATILGVNGDSNVVDTTLASGGATSAQILSGYGAYVNGTLVSGSATVPVVSQDATTKVLSIS